jgi:hypothetical protein
VANVKIGNIVSDVFGVSGQAMVSVLVSGEEITAEQIADLSKRRLRLRIPELTEALQRHQMNEHHRWLISQSVEHAVLLDRQIEQVESRITEKLQAWQEPYELLQTIPGIKEMTAATILAEIGADMSQFESAKHLSHWAGICPGNNRSAGKSKHSRIKKGNKFLLAALVQAAWAAARKRDSIFQRKFHRWMHRLGEAKANIAMAHSLLELVYAHVKDGAALPGTRPRRAARHGEGEAGAAPCQTAAATRSRRKAGGRNDSQVKPAGSLLLTGPEAGRQSGAHTHPARIPGKDLPGSTRISSPPNPETRIFGCERTIGRKSFSGTASIKTQN